MQKSLLEFSKAISEPKRLLILHSLKDESCVGELWKCLKLPQNLTSHHLRVLKNAKLIKSEKQGSKVVYKLDKKQLQICIKELNNYLK